MFAINHAATALLIKRQFPEHTLIVLFISVQIVITLFLVGFYSLRPPPRYVKH